MLDESSAATGEKSVELSAHVLPHTRVQKLGEVESVQVEARLAAVLQ
ncbi:hypothetical protein GCM10009827_068780 [Dactylosporangium maewongense]|uniref:Uncharacterized protein n=1 Tax=Dactylosporangium maewongense TaxID=634393 RepID=A0ABP4M8F9_9ACTN